MIVATWNQLALIQTEGFASHTTSGVPIPTQPLWIESITTMDQYKNCKPWRTNFAQISIEVRWIYGSLLIRDLFQLCEEREKP
jgi:hypothetical protein